MAETAEQVEETPEAGSQPDIEAMVNQFVDQRLAARQEPEPTPGTDNFAAALRHEETVEPEPEVPSLSDADLDLLEQAGFFGEPEVEEPQEPQLPPEVLERIDRLEQHLAQQSEEQAFERLNALEAKYPDITSDEIFPELKARVDEFADRFGLNVASDPGVVEMLYRNIKFDAVKASETPAELAATRGMSLETGAGPSEQGEPDAAKEYIKALREAGGGGSAFV